MRFRCWASMRLRSGNNYFDLECVRNRWHKGRHWYGVTPRPDTT